MVLKVSYLWILRPISAVADFRESSDNTRKFQCVGD
jgi:hypothetical protein